VFILWEGRPRHARAAPRLFFPRRPAGEGSGSGDRREHVRSLAPGLPRRPCLAAYGLGPSVFTLRAERRGTDRASVSQPVACRGPRRSRHVARDLHVPPGVRGSRNRGEGRHRRPATGRVRGAGPGPGGTLVCGSEIPGRAPGPGRPGHLPPERSAGGGWPSCGTSEPSGAEVLWFARPTRAIVPPGKPQSPSPAGFDSSGRPGARDLRVLLCPLCLLTW